MNRKNRLKIFGKLYVHFSPEGLSNTCFYCGAVASTIDHQPPLSYIENVGSSEEIINQMVTIPCCHECNTILSSHYTPTLVDRFDLCKIILKRRYRKIIKQKEWSKEDSDDLGRGLKDFIEESQAHYESINLRINYVDSLLKWLER